jgi:hypothetical protein
MARSGTSWVGKMLLAGGHFGYVHEPFNLTSPPGAVRVPVQHWYTYVNHENEQSVLPALADALEFRYPLGRELGRCRGLADFLHTAKMWRRSIRSRNLRPLVKEPHAVFSAEWFARRLHSQVVITVRHPAAVVGSWTRLGWNFDFADLLAQPMLLQDWLEPFREEMKAAMAPSHDTIDRIALLWRVVYSVVAACQSRSPDLIVVRHEDLSRRPVAEFGTLYRRLGLAYTAEVAEVVRASSDKANPAELPDGGAYGTAMNSAANVDRWKRRLRREDLARIRKLTAAVAARYYPEAEWEL